MGSCKQIYRNLLLDSITPRCCLRNGAMILVRSASQDDQIHPQSHPLHLCCKWNRHARHVYPVCVPCEVEYYASRRRQERGRSCQPIQQQRYHTIELGNYQHNALECTLLALVMAFVESGLPCLILVFTMIMIIIWSLS